MPASSGTKRRAKLPAALQLGRSGVHGYGVFARDFIAQGERLIEYVGERITKREAERREDARLARRAAGEDGCVYIFEMTKRYDIDGDVPWNPARHINHSCAPNCEVQDIRSYLDRGLARPRPGGGTHLRLWVRLRRVVESSLPLRCGRVCGLHREERAALARPPEAGAEVTHQRELFIPAV
jgi:hypothetical protein